MRPYFLKFEPNPFDQKISLKNKVILLGSCFSDEMGLFFENHGFHVLSNPFGTIYHPNALAELVYRNLQNNIEPMILTRDDVYLSWDCSSKIHGYSDTELKTNYTAAHHKFKEFLADEGVLIITLGTAFGYVHKETGNLVANCHKYPGSTFTKKLFSVDEMLECWSETLNAISNQYPDIRVVFTISPVRHIKDGIVENNRSKARLIELVQQLEEKFGIYYFPGYELCMDVLRDYRFYKEDFVHPNNLAVLEIWQMFKGMGIDANDYELMDHVAKLKSSANHKSIFKASSSEAKRQEELGRKLDSIKRDHPFLNL